MRDGRRKKSDGASAPARNNAGILRWPSVQELTKPMVLRPTRDSDPNENDMEPTPQGRALCQNNVGHWTKPRTVKKNKNQPLYSDDYIRDVYNSHLMDYFCFLSLQQDNNWRKEGNKSNCRRPKRRNKKNRDRWEQTLYRSNKLISSEIMSSPSKDFFSSSGEFLASIKQFHWSVKSKVKVGYGLGKHGNGYGTGKEGVRWANVTKRSGKKSEECHDPWAHSW